MGFLTTMIVLLSMAASKATNLHAESVSPAVSYWHEKLPMTPIPNVLKELISPVSEEDEKVAVNVSKGGVGVSVKPPVQGKGGVGVSVKPPVKGKGGVGVSVNPPVKGKGGGGVSVHTPGNGVGVHVGTKSPYDYAYAATQEMLADPSLSMFFLEKDLHPGTTVTLYLSKRSTANFLPRRIAGKIPFSSDKLSVAMQQLNIPQDSETAVAMKETVEECESPAINGESKYCATSLESLVDYATARLGTNRTRLLATNVPNNSKAVKQQYSITAVSIQSKSGSKSVVCHSETYAYAVYYCHEAKGTRTVQASLKGEDGSSAEGVAVCHADTSAWNPEHVAFKVLKVKPGGAAICHFIPQDHIVWLPAN